MAGDDLTWPGVDEYLDAVESRLGGPARWRASVRAELADGLVAAAQAYLDRGPAADRADAVRRARADFGPPEVVAASFAGEAAAQVARRSGLGLLASGPLAAACWVSAILATGAHPAPHQLAGAARLLPAFGIAIAATAASAVLALAGTGRAGRWLGARSVRLPVVAATLATGLCVAADALAVTAFAGWVATSPRVTVGVPAGLAVGFSLVRLTLAARASRRCGAAAARLA